MLLANPNRSFYKENLAISYSKLGSTHSALGNLEQALEFCEDDLVLTKELYTSYPTNVSFKNGLAISYSKLGSTHSALGNLEQALKFYEERSRLGKELYTSYPTNVSFKNGLAISYAQLGRFYRDQMENTAQARSYFKQCLVLWQALANDYPAFVEYQKNLKWVQNNLADLDKADDPVILLKRN